MQEAQVMQVWSLGWGDLLEEEMATDSSTRAGKIPWAEEPGGLHSMGSQRAGHDWDGARTSYEDWHPRGTRSSAGSQGYEHARDMSRKSSQDEGDGEHVYKQLNTKQSMGLEVDSWCSRHWVSRREFYWIEGRKVGGRDRTNLRLMQTLAPTPLSSL